MDEKNILGVLGGLGPKATAYFFELLVDNTVASFDQDHINAIFLNHSTTPDRTEAILSGKYKRLRESLIKDCQFLEKAGASFIAIPCNTSHYFWSDINDSVSIEVINMIEEAINYIRRRNGEVRKIGVLATDGTVKTGLYDNECAKQDVEVIYPSIEFQNTVMEVIYSGVKGGNRVEITKLDNCIDYLKEQGCDGVILGCTELSVLFKGCKEPYVTDALYALAKKAIILSGKKVKD